MPFTPVHALVALPFARRPWPLLSTGGRTWALTALTVGAMAPDLPLFLDVLWHGAHKGSSYSHRLPALPLVLMTTLIITALWVQRVRPPFLAALPRRSPGAVSPAPPVPPVPPVLPGERVLRSPAPAPARDRRIVEALVVIGAAVLGILSHLLWDDFTHRRGTAVQTWSVLREQLFDRPVYVYLQHGSSALGVLVLLAVAYGWYRRAVPAAAPRRLRSLVVAIMAGAAAGVLGAVGRLLHDDVRVTAYSLARLAATFPVLGAVLGLLVWALVVGVPVRDGSLERPYSGAHI